MTKKYKKPYRPCPFCKKLFSNLRKHLERKHKHTQEVQVALSLPKQHRTRAFDALRKKGILIYNLNIMNKKEPAKRDLQRERKVNKGENKIAYCSKCYAFVSNALFYRHRRLCYMADNCTDVPQNIHPSITLGLDKKAEFEKQVLNSFKNDAVGKICRSDPLITAYGRREFRRLLVNADKRDEKRKTLKNDMRRLARLYIAFQEICRKEKIKTPSTMSMFNRQYFSTLEASIVSISSDDEGRTKDGFKLSVGYLLKKVGKYIYGSLLEAKEDERAVEITKFLDLLNFNWLNIFSVSEYAVKNARQSVLRKPANLPLEEDVTLLRNYTVDQISKVTQDTSKCITKSCFILLRDLLVCRLTLFNARRGGEPSRLTIAEWRDAENDVWQHNNQIDKVKDPIDKTLWERFKLAYQPGKTGKLVPLLIIDDCWRGLQIVVDREIRTQVGVGEDNEFVFPYTKLSNHHVQGWNAVDRCCKLAGCSKTINATSRRHQVSTMYAAQEVPSEDRAGFLIHIDHSEKVNLNIYQSPQVVTEITKVGKFFLHLDKTGNKFLKTQTLFKLYLR